MRKICFLFPWWHSHGKGKLIVTFPVFCAWLYDCVISLLFFCLFGFSFPGHVGRSLLVTSSREDFNSVKMNAWLCLLSHSDHEFVLVFVLLLFRKFNMSPRCQEVQICTGFPSCFSFKIPASLRTDIAQRSYVGHWDDCCLLIDGELTLKIESELYTL